MRIAHKSLLQENKNISKNNLSILVFECINKKELCWGVPRHRFSPMYRWKDNFRVNQHFRGMTTKNETVYKSVIVIVISTTTIATMLGCYRNSTVNEDFYIFIQIVF